MIHSTRSYRNFCWNKGKKIGQKQWEYRAKCKKKSTRSSGSETLAHFKEKIKKEAKSKEQELEQRKNKYNVAMDPQY